MCVNPGTAFYNETERSSWSRVFTTILLLISWIITEFDSLLWISEFPWFSSGSGALAIWIHRGVMRRPIHKTSWTYKFMRKRQKNGFNCLQFFVIFGWNFPHWHAVEVGKFSCLIRANSSLMNKVTLVTYHKFWDFSIAFSQTIVIVFLKPCFQCPKWTFSCDVIHEDHSTHIPVVMNHHAFTESLLTCSIPDL